eukprot:scaffold17082_cov150-Skeletonema_dohrnii-CCMP3373.AAC.8
MKTTKQHLDALLAVEGDSKFDGFAESVKTLRRKQNVQTHSQSATFEWIKTSRELSQLEHNMTQQLERTQTNMGLISSPRTQEQLELDAMSLVIGLKDALEVSQDKKKREMILDTKQRLNKMEENLEQQCAALEAETRMQRHRALQLVSDGNKQCNVLPPSLLEALDSLRTLGDEDCDSEVELLKQELLGELEAAKHKRDKIHYEKIKKKGLGDVERLRKRIIEKSRLSTNKAKNEAKQRELKAKLALLRAQQQLSDTQNQQESSRPNCKVADEKVIDVQKRLEAMQVLAKHQLRQVQDHEKENAEVLLQEEMMKQRKMCFNKERSTFRQEQRQQKLIAQQEAEDKMTRERELQLERLSFLAMSCPYQKKIADLSADIHKSTNARQNDFFRRQSDLADFQLDRHTSFTDEKIFSDKKFRLANSLHEAGINKTIAARDVIRNVIPRTEERTTGIKPY